MTLCHVGRLRKRQLGELGWTDKVSYSLRKKNWHDETHTRAVWL